MEAQKEDVMVVLSAVGTGARAIALMMPETLPNRRLQLHLLPEESLVMKYLRDSMELPPKGWKPL
jgi:hypothetical protein